MRIIGVLLNEADLYHGLERRANWFGGFCAKIDYTRSSRALR